MAVAITLAVALRLAYVGYVGWSLRSEEAAQRLGFERFRRTASRIMNLDGVALVLACWVTRGTLHAGLSTLETAVVGGGLILAGVGTKVWAARTLGGKGYYWYDFFIPPDQARHTREGAYRFLANPMYTVGYLQCYGLAVVLDSWPGLLLSLFAQLAILGFYLVIERPHYQRVYGGR